MADDTGRDLLVRGIAAAKAGSHDEARFFLERTLRTDPPLATRVQAWRYLAEIATDDGDKRRWLAQILAVDPTDGLARRDIAILNGELHPDAIVNPDAPDPAADGGLEEAAGRRLSCSRCGSARVIFEPDGRSLTCEHCGYREATDGDDSSPTRNGTAGTDVRDHDFAATMWTARGRRVPRTMLSFACDTCGSRFVLPAGTLSLTCAYCGAVHVGISGEPRDLIAPEAVVPFALDEGDAREALDTWQEDNGVRTPVESVSSLFVPVWMFTFAGEIQWAGVQRERSVFGSRSQSSVSGTRTVIDASTLVCATHRIPSPLRHLLDSFELDQLAAFDPRYLAGRLTETYALSLEDAAIEARRQVIGTMRVEVAEELEDVEQLKLSFAGVGIDTFTLVLLPFWIARVGDADEHYVALVNGQTGKTDADLPLSGWRGWIPRLW